MRRREMIMLLGGATAWPLTVRAQRPTVPVIGFLNSRSKFKGEAVAMAVHPSSPTAESQMQDAVVAARQNGVALHFVNVADAPGLDAAFTAIQANALVIMVDPFFDSRAAEVVAGSARRHMPTMYYI